MRRRELSGFTCELRGTITSAGFSSGHRFVVGSWEESPIGPLADVMWARPDGRRILLVDRREAADFITAVYRFDTVEVVPLACRVVHGLLEVDAGGVQLILRGGRPWPIPLAKLRNRTQVRPLERLLARGLLGVRTWGVTPSGVQEWYRADEYRRVVAGQANLDGRDLGPVRPFPEPARFGFSEPPRCPSMVRVRPLLHDPSGRLARAVGHALTEDGP
jgi:hypothetical protein